MKVNRTRKKNFAIGKLRKTSIKIIDHMDVRRLEFLGRDMVLILMKSKILNIKNTRNNKVR